MYQGSKEYGFGEDDAFLRGSPGPNRQNSSYSKNSSYANRLHNMGSSSPAFDFLASKMKMNPNFASHDEYPSLGTQNQLNSGFNPVGGIRGYAGMINQQEQKQEFSLGTEDFPVLGGGPVGSGPVTKTPVSEFHESDASARAQMQLQEDLISRSLRKPVKQRVETQMHQNQFQQPVMRKPQVTQQQVIDNFKSKYENGELCCDGQGVWHNVPDSVLKNQFGLLSLLLANRLPAEKQMLTHGIDLMTLGLPLEKGDKITEKFGGPFSDMPCRPQDIDFIVPSEYLTNDKISEKLMKMNLDMLIEDTVFMLYYTNPRDIMSVACRDELTRKAWRYHKKERRWLKRLDSESKPIIGPQGNHIGETGTFKFFNPDKWAMEKRENWELLYADIEDVPANSNNQMSESKMELKRQQMFIENQRNEALRAKQKSQQQQYQQQNTNSDFNLNNQNVMNNYNNMNFSQFVSLR